MATGLFFPVVGDGCMNVLVVQRQSLVAGVNFSLSVHARIIEAMDWLRDQGMIEYACCGESEDVIFAVLKWADAVIFNKHFSDRAIAIAHAAQKAGCVTLLDLDDLVTAFPSYSGGAAKGQNRFTEMIELMDCVTVSNARLLEAVRPLRPDCVLMPNGIYVEKYQRPMREEHPPRCLITNADYLKMHFFKRDFIRLLQTFHQQHPRIAIDYFGDPFPEIASLPFIHFVGRKPYTDYLHCLAQTGYCFALVPLGGREDAENARFNSCKNPFKLLNYAVTGIPAIYSEACIYSEAVEDGVTGLLVSNTFDAWMTAMERLLGDADLRQLIRYNSYEEVRKKYHISTAATLYYQLLNNKYATQQASQSTLTLGRLP